MELNQSTFYAGAAQVNSTPPLGTVINGDFRAHYANYIHDPLYVRAIVLRSDKQTLVLVIIDICVLPKAYIDQIKEEIRSKLGLTQWQVLISSTHTHAAGSVGEAYLSGVDAGYAKKLPGLIIKAIEVAIEKLKPAKVAFGKIDVPNHVRSRRYFMNGYTPLNPVNGEEEVVKTNPFGAESYIVGPSTATDPEVGYLALQGLDGKWISILANYSLHYVGDWNNGTISADYFGYFASALKNKINADDDFVGIMSNGTSGDINIWEFIKQEHYPEEHFEKSKFIGNDIAQKLSDSLQSIEWETNPALASSYKEIKINTRKPTLIELEKAKKVVSETDYESLFIDDDGLTKVYAREQVLLNEYPKEILFPVHAIKIGKGKIGGLAAEIFAETGLEIKKNTVSKNYFTISMANGYFGYVPTEDAFLKGGYETWRSRTSFLQKESHNILQTTIVNMINAL